MFFNKIIDISYNIVPELFQYSMESRNSLLNNLILLIISNNLFKYSLNVKLFHIYVKNFLKSNTNKNIKQILSTERISSYINYLKAIIYDSSSV